MTELSIAMAKLAGIQKATLSARDENVSRNRSAGEKLTRSNFSPELVGHYFFQSASILNQLRRLAPELYGDFQEVAIEPDTEMLSPSDGTPAPKHFSKAQLDCLIRDIDQIFEIRANSELAQPTQRIENRVFISHGRSNDWRSVQAFIEKDIKLQTLELAQQSNGGRTIIEKLIESANTCNSAVIVMSGDDIANGDESRVRENVMHEIGFFQGSYGRSYVILLHEEGVNIPTNLAGVAYIPYPKGYVESGFHVLHRELRSTYKL